MGENPAGHHRLFIGCYTKGTGRGIYSATLDRATGALGAPELSVEAPNPTFLALSPDRKFLYAVCAGPGWVSSFRVDAGSPGLVPVQQSAPDASPTPCHVAVDATGRIALAANYHLGQAAAIPLNADGTFGAPRVVSHSGHGPHPTIQTKPHVHSTNIARDNRIALVCDLGLDRIYTYVIDRDAVALVPGTTPFVSAAPGAGPRHLAFSRDGSRAYAINELDSTVVAYRYDPAAGGLAHLQTVGVVPKGYAGDSAAAEVCIHPNGRFLYGSCRGPDVIAVFAINEASGLLEPVESVPCGGKGPRNFSISPDGAWLVCAHQGSDTLCSFRVDGGSGRLQRIPGTVSVSMPVCVVFAN
jgi:6-phosphogluconolactonase